MTVSIQIWRKKNNNNIIELHFFILSFYRLLRIVPYMRILNKNTFYAFSIQKRPTKHTYIFAACNHMKHSGASQFTKLTMSLVNDSLKCQMAILQIHCYFLLEKCENPLQCKGFSHLFNKKTTVCLFFKKMTVFIFEIDI